MRTWNSKHLLIVQTKINKHILNYNLYETVIKMYWVVLIFFHKVMNNFYTKKKDVL